MYRGRPLVENRVGEVQARGGGGGGSGRGGGVGGGQGINVALSPGNFVSVCLCARADTKSRARHHFIAVLSKLHVLMEHDLDDLPILQIYCLRGLRRV